MPDQAETLQQLLQAVEVADAGFGGDLWLIAERIMLFRLARAGVQKRLELAAMVHLLRRIFSETQGEAMVPPELIQLDEAASNAFKGSVEANLSLVFTTIVDMVESMNSGQLYPLISRLRKMELPEQPVIDVEPLEKAEEFLSEGLQQQEDEWGI